eukprot:769466-Rhodomonas_salina.1
MKLHGWRDPQTNKEIPSAGAQNISTKRAAVLQYKERYRKQRGVFARGRDGWMDGWLSLIHI